MTVIVPAVDATDIVAGVTLKVLSTDENVVEVESEATVRSRSTRIVSDDFTFEIIDGRVSLG
jgi:hypothetical protein